MDEFGPVFPALRAVALFGRLCKAHGRIFLGLQQPTVFRLLLSGHGRRIVALLGVDCRRIGRHFDRRRSIGSSRQKGTLRPRLGFGRKPSGCHSVRGRSAPLTTAVLFRIAVDGLPLRRNVVRRPIRHSDRTGASVGVLVRHCRFPIRHEQCRR